MSDRCQNCGKLMDSERDAQFCSQPCRINYEHPTFCGACLEETIPISAGDMETVNGIGIGLYGKGHVCQACGSLLQRVCFCILFIPVIPLAKFRVKYRPDGKYLSRRTRRLGPAGAQRDLKDLQEHIDRQAHALLERATKLEAKGMVAKATAAYHQVARDYPGTSASDDAKASLRSLEANTSTSHLPPASP